MAYSCAGKNEWTKKNVCQHKYTNGIDFEFSKELKKAVLLNWTIVQIKCTIVTKLFVDQLNFRLFETMVFLKNANVSVTMEFVMRICGLLSFLDNCSAEISHSSFLT